MHSSAFNASTRRVGICKLLCRLSKLLKLAYRQKRLSSDGVPVWIGGAGSFGSWKHSCTHVVCIVPTCHSSNSNPICYMSQAVLARPLVTLVAPYRSSLILSIPYGSTVTMASKKSLVKPKKAIEPATRSVRLRLEDHYTRQSDPSHVCRNCWLPSSTPLLRSCKRRNVRFLATALLQTVESRLRDAWTWG